MKSKKIAFCITCMNRIEHIQATLLKNIQDNYLVDDVEFVLLDYNSADGLSEWVAENFSEYIKEGILTYYKTFTPTAYHRSHSRNMAFKLANAELVCNLDADNFLGEGFASFLIEQFEREEGIFCSSNYHIRDVIGRICMRKKDFLQIRGYNEIFSGYGFEDVELTHRLKRNGLKQRVFANLRYYGAIRHLHEDRLSEEDSGKSQYRVFLSYLSPYETHYVAIKKDNRYERGLLVDNRHINETLVDKTLEHYEKILDERFQVMPEDFEEGSWSDDENTLILKQDNTEKIDFLHQAAQGKFILNDIVEFYEVTDAYIKTLFSFLLSGAKNIKCYIDFMRSGNEVNKDGYGQGVVYKNFNFNDSIEVV